MNQPLFTRAKHNRHTDDTNAPIQRRTLNIEQISESAVPLKIGRSTLKVQRSSP